MLVAGIDAPGAGQHAAGVVADGNGAAGHAVAEHAKGFLTCLNLAPVRVRGVEQIAESALGDVRLSLEPVALGDEGRIDLDAHARSPAPLVARMADAASTGRAGWRLQRIGGAVVAGIDLLQSAHDLSAAPSLVDAQVGDDIRSLHATVCSVAREQRAATANRGAGASAASHRTPRRCAWEATRGNGAAARESRRARRARQRVGVDDLRRTARFRRNRTGEATTKLCGIGPHPPATVTGVGSGQIATAILRGWHAIEVEERL